MATSPRSATVKVSADVSAEDRLHIHGIKEMPAGYDAEVAELFRDLRAASGLSEADLAAQLATRPEVVQALEQGALFALPPWPETYRVVATYGTLLNLDVQPLLRRIYAQVEAGIVELAPKSMPDVPFMAPPDGRDRQPRGQPASPMRPEPAPRQQPRQAGAPQPRGPQGAPGRPAPGPRQAQAPQMRPGVPPRPHAPQPHAPQPHAPQPHAPPQHRPGPPRPFAPPPQGAPPMPARGRPPVPPQGRAVPKPPPGAVQPPRAAPLSEPKPTRKTWPWKPVLKWGAVVLIVLGGAFALWKWLAEPALLGSGPAPKPGASAPSAPDPNDPRSRKADRLPGAS
jgi:transcriptional regulator with XRE-family HTH domain